MQVTNKLHEGRARARRANCQILHASLQVIDRQVPITLQQLYIHLVYTAKITFLFFESLLVLCACVCV